MSAHFLVILLLHFQDSPVFQGVAQAVLDCENPVEPFACILKVPVLIQVALKHIEHGYFL
jgi:hypothetical protein